jgi:hypothetical protein
MRKPYPFLIRLAGTGRFELETYCFFAISFCGRVELRQDLSFFPSQLGMDEDFSPTVPIGSTGA